MNDEQFDRRDREHHKDIQRLKNKHHFAIRKLQENLKHYETGFKGACPTCENVGTVNLKLQENLKIAIDALKNLIDKTEYGVNQWQKAWSPDKETEGQKAIKKARQALEKIKRF